MTQRALVTGGAGFIGSSVVRRLLDAGWRVGVFDDFSNGLPGNLAGLPVGIQHADIRDRAVIERACEGVDAVFHMAAVVGNVRSIEDPHRDAEVNMMGTVNVLHAAVRAKVPRLVYSSSAACYGETGLEPIHETHMQEPASPYGASKLAGEKHALAVGRLHPIIVVALRYFNAFGIRQRNDAYGNVIPIFTHRALTGEPLVIYGDGEQTRDFVTVEDIAEANMRAVLNARATGVFNVGSGTPRSINTIASLCRELTGSSSAIVRAPARLGEVRNCTADIQSIRSQLGFQPSADFAESLGQYVRWVKATTQP